MTIADTTDLTARANLDDDQFAAYMALRDLDVAGHFGVLYRLAMAHPRIVMRHVERMGRAS